MAREIIVILIGVGLGILGVLLLRVGRQIARFLLALGGLGVAGAVAYALVAQASATRQAAQAARVAGAGQAVGGLATTVLAVLLTGVVLAAVIGGGYLTFRLRRAERRLGARHWMLGPDAHWGQLGQRDGGTGEQWQQTLQQLLLLETLRVLRDLRRPRYPPVAYGGPAPGTGDPSGRLYWDESGQAEWDTLLDGLDGDEWW